MQQNISFSEFEGKTDQNKKNKTKKHLQTGVTTAFEKCPFVNRQADVFIHLHTACFIVWEEQHRGEPLKA